MDKPDTVPTDHECPDGCDATLEYGHFVDAREGIRGYSCPECDTIWTTGDLKGMGVIED